MSGISFAGWAVDAMIASALLMAIVLLVRGPVRRAFGPQIAYALWALPLLRLVLPPMPAGWHTAAVTPIGQAGQAFVLIVTPVADPTAPTLFRQSLSLVALVWAAGAACFLLYHLINHLRFCRRIVSRATPGERIDGIQVVTSPAATGPLAFGVWRRYVAFPADMAERYDADERALALAHEIGHHQRGDLIANWAALSVLALHWFNPLAWRAFHAFRMDQELANDARVLLGRSVCDRHIYACAIVKAAHGGAVSAACHLHTIADLKGRLKMLATSPTSRRRLASGAATVGALLVAGLGLTASGSSAAAISEGVQDAVAQVAAPPAPPASPALPAPGSSTTTSTTVFRSSDGVHHGKRIVVVRDGKTTTYNSADTDADLAAHDRVAILPLAKHSSRMIFKMDGDPNTRIEVQDIPAVSSAECGIGKGNLASMVVDEGKGVKRKIVICTDRIRQVTADAMVTATNSKIIERNAYSQGLAGLISARARITANIDMSIADRDRALAAIDQSIAEMKGQLAHLD